MQDYEEGGDQRREGDDGNWDGNTSAAGHLEYFD